VKAASDDPRDLARAYRELGYRAAQCPKIPLEDGDRIRAVREAFEKEDVVIAECNAWGNLMPADEEERRAARRRVCDALALADEIGARCTVSFLGTFAPDSKFGPHPDNLGKKGFDACVETVRSIIDEAKPRRAKFCLEMMQWILPDSPEVYVELIEAVDRPAFGVHLDPVNLIVSPRIYFDTGELLRRCFRLLGEWVVSCHAKDIILRDNLALHLDEIRPGLGGMDYRTFLRELDRLPGETPLMLEHLKTPEEYGLARDHIFAVGKELKIDFGA
jgi:sugar phosphate isomerase/epimerase